MILESDSGRAGSSASTTLLDPLLDHQRRDVLAVRRVDPGVEEELHREEAARGVHVLVADDPRDGRLVHADVLGHLAQDHRPQVLDAAVEEVLLERDDAAATLKIVRWRWSMLFISQTALLILSRR